MAEKRTVPIVALRGSVVFPRVESVLTFGRPKTKSAVNASFNGDRLLAIFTQKDARVADPGKEDLYEVGTLSVIQQLMPTESEIHALVQGTVRIKLGEIISQEPFVVGRVQDLEEDIKGSSDEEALARHLTQLFEKSVRLGKAVDVQTVMRLLSSRADPAEVVDQVAYLLDLGVSQKQKVLSTLSLEQRLKKVIDYLGKEVGILDLEKTIATKTQKRFEGQMRRAMLEERKRTIDQELRGLGEGADGEEDEMGELRAKIKAAGLPKDVRKKAEKELSRLSQMSPHNPESGYIRNYLDWIVEMPWRKVSPNNVSIKHASKILDDDHYGLKKAKERILEFLAVMHLKTELEGKRKKKRLNGEVDGGHPTILCLVGPPGVGKTSIGKSIARALGRKFVRVSLGGIRDEAEIRGHRRTYVGSMPGRIIQGIKNAGTKNPIFMLDEVDKIGMDFRGDPSSALLEALDPEQNKEFSDHYLEVPFDLSHVMFICTANMMDTVPYALRDRMEIILFPGYTEDEKYSIAKTYLWRKQLEAHGLDKKFEMTPAALREVIARYTREAGVRSLERNLAGICRKVARRVSEKKRIGKQIKIADVHKYLGPPQFKSLLAEREDEVGMATGLAVTPAGGDILFIETALMPGKGKLTLTGQLGDVMKESAKAAFSYAKSHWRELDLPEDFASKLDAHIHVPEGAVPKDGPSAGIAMATSLVSALTNSKTKREVAMTGEITLRGRVMEIGGVKEKVIASHRAGIKTVILPKDNKKDMKDIPGKIQKDIKFRFVEHLDEVLAIALRRSQKKRSLPEEILPSAYASS